jgi:cytochrome c5
MSFSTLEKGMMGATCALVLLVLAMDVPSARRPAPPAPYPPTPAALATARADQAAAERAAAAKAEAERLAAVQNPGETEDILPAGHAREEVFARCTACHSTAIIRRSGFSRERWDELMDWMTEKQGMAPLEGDVRTRVVDYLAEHFPPRRSPRNANPFLN